MLCIQSLDFVQHLWEVHMRVPGEKMNKKLEAIEDAVPPWEKEHDFGAFNYEADTNAYDAIKEKRDTVQAHPLYKTAWQYMKKMHAFLKEVYYEKEDCMPDLKYDYDTVAWYHTLLSAKMYRALCDIYKPEEDEGDSEMRFYSLCDGVAQLAICTKAINESDKALRSIIKKNCNLGQPIHELLVILHNMSSRIHMIEERI